MTQQALLPDKDLSPPRCCVLHAWITRDVFARIELASAKRRMHPDQVAARLLSIIATEDLFDQFLDS